jgi:hypothetical protein
MNQSYSPNPIAHFPKRVRKNIVPVAIRHSAGCAPPPLAKGSEKKYDLLQRGLGSSFGKGKQFALNTFLVKKSSTPLEVAPHHRGNANKSIRENKNMIPTDIKYAARYARGVLLLAVLSCLTTTPIIAAEVLYGGLGGHNNMDSTNDGALAIVNQTTGAVTIVGHPVDTPPITRISGLVFEPAGNLYASTLTPSGGFPPPSGPRTSNLIALNPSNGALLSSVAITDAAGGAGLSIADLAVQPGTNTLFGITSDGDLRGGMGMPGQLFSINASTGVATLVGNTGYFFNSLAFAPDGTLYASVANLDFATGMIIDKAFAKINPATAATVTSVTTAHFFGALAVRSDGKIFGGTGDQHQLYNINPTTGAETLIGDTGSTFIGDLAFSNTGVVSETANISTRAFVQTADNVMIAGFILRGSSATHRVLVRVLGPSLPSSIATRMADPTLDLRDNNGTRILFNDNWKDDSAQAALITATGIPPTNDLESAMVVDLPAGTYTAIVAGTSNGTGVAVVEVYNLTN